MDLCNSLALLCCWCCDHKDPDEEQYDHDERVKKASQFKPASDDSLVSRQQPGPVQTPQSGPTQLQQTVEVQDQARKSAANDLPGGVEGKGGSNAAR